MNVRLKYTTKFTAGIFYDGELQMNNYTVHLKMITVTTDGEDQNIALDRVKYFIHNQLGHSVFINGADQEQCQALLAAGVRISNLPEEPVDQIIGMMMYSKLNAIMEDRIVLAEIELSSEMGDNVVYCHCDEEPLGPIELPGWWNESDTSHCDLSSFQNKKIVSIASELNWKDLRLNWTDDDVTINEGDNTVLFANFKKDETE